MFSRAATFQVIIASSVASLGAALAYLIVSLATMRSINLSNDVAIWVLLIAALTLPVTLLSSAGAIPLLKLSGYPRIAISIIVMSLFPFISMIVFTSYMDMLSPATNWQRGWWLPLIASLISILLTWSMAVKNSAKREVS